ncbi:hypothetical protein ABW21_db0200898 [Orbilia brochopaga]|nr:hypothetical protein ABW21_db0200898 [Drechslerella brochopaga]
MDNAVEAQMTGFEENDGELTNGLTTLKVIHKPLVVSNDGGLYSVTLSDEPTVSKQKDDVQNDMVMAEPAKQVTENHEESKDLEIDEEKENRAQVNGDTVAKVANKRGKSTKGDGKPAGGKRGRKPKAKDESEGQDQGDGAAKTKGRGGRKRKDAADAGTEGDKTNKAKPKRARTSTSKKSSLSPLEQVALLTPPESPQPPSADQVAAEAAKSAFEEARKERLKKLPFYREEMKEIFDYLCDRGVYWRNDLPRNKRFSNRDCKLLEKEVRKKVSEILDGYPLEEEVMKPLKEEEEKIKLQAGIEEGGKAGGEVAEVEERDETMTSVE